MNNNSFPKISVIVPCYNYGRFLEQCLNSILLQSIDDFEIVVINDCSADETKEVMEQFVSNPKIKIIHHAHNIGFPKTVNEGVRIARGKYIAMVSADDYLINKSALYILSNFIDTHNEVGFVHSAQYFSDGNRNILYSIYRRDKI